MNVNPPARKRLGERHSSLHCPACDAPLAVGVTASTMHGERATIQQETTCVRCGAELVITATVRWAGSTASFATKDGRAAVSVAAADGAGEGADDDGKPG